MSCTYQGKNMNNSHIKIQQTSNKNIPETQKLLLLNAQEEENEDKEDGEVVHPNYI